VAQVAVCSQINTKHKYNVERTYSCWMLNWWCITWTVGFKRLIYYFTARITEHICVYGYGLLLYLFERLLFYMPSSILSTLNISAIHIFKTLPSFICVLNSDLQTVSTSYVSCF